MCGTCGCTDVEETHDHGIGHDHSHEHSHAHVGHEHPHDHGPPTVLRIEQAVLAKNDRFAEGNRGFFEARGILALNLVSAPGAGKTALLERTIRDLGRETALGVIEGDQETDNDAMRIRAAGCRAVQINTGAGCHLDAERVGVALRALEPAPSSIVFIENVGNLVCPAMFDLGERAKVAILSVTEGEDKPVKYPHMFRAAEVLLVSKTDLLPHLEFDIELCVANARRVNPRIRVFPVSVREGAGLASFYNWIRDELAQRRKEAR